MIEIVLPDVREHYEDQLDQMFRMRFETCIRKWGWNVPGATDDRDIDEFDNEEAVYMLLLSDDRQTVLGWFALQSDHLTLYDQQALARSVRSASPAI